MNPVLMLARNCKALTKNAIDSVLAQDIPVDLLVIDQDSTDGTDEILKGYGDRIRVMLMRPQPGVSRGWNIGLSYFFDKRMPHVLVVNNDVVLRSDTYRELIADGGGFVTAVSVGDVEQIRGEFVKSVRNHPDFSCYMIRREVWNKVGPFDDSMRIYASDGDYHLRMHQKGINACTIGIPFYHVASGTIKHSSPEDSRAIQIQADADRAVFRAKWGCGIGTPEYYALFGTEAP